MTKPTDKVPGKTYTYSDLVEAQVDAERLRLGSSYASKERTKAMVNQINKHREGGK